MEEWYRSPAWISFARERVVGARGQVRTWISWSLPDCQSEGTSENSPKVSGIIAVTVPVSPRVSGLTGVCVQSSPQQAPLDIVGDPQILP